ncbi:ComE operon protein 3 [Calidithermus terrae]|uniref:ComE operon protein 3 n=1 Tax=Calidithermus terrae TaxID=1408545 RepID=A0A399EEG0_9DEIN|nr:DNA internalization-related competence protein ComEC/Rec2 [Calidithermus terrae]RIH82715.1 ComE operon protein 3 [Calidithermus terrae]
MIPHALGLGALAGALTQAGPLAYLSLLLLPLWPRPERGFFAAAFALLCLRLLLPADPWAGQVGQRVELEGTLREGFLSTPQGRVYVRHFPALKDGRYRLGGVLQRPQGRRNPGGFDQAAWLRGLGVTAVLKVERVIRGQPPPPGLREVVRGRLEAGLSPAIAALAVAMTLGERRDLGETYEQFQRSGLAHALALSGLNVAILTGFLVLLLSFLGPYRYLAALAVLLAYLALVGPSASLVRAEIMAALVLVALFLGKGKVDVLAALAWALAVHLLAQPFALFSLSFQLSYLAVLGMALVLPRLPRPAGVRGWVLAGFAVTFAAQLLLLPLLLHNFHALPLLSPVANLLVLPFLNLLVPLGFLKMFAGEWLAWPVEGLGRLALGLVALFAQGPQLRWGEIAPAGFALYYAGVLPLLAVLYRQLSWRRGALLSGSAALASGLGLLVPPAEYWQLDVGQGDAALLRLPGGVEILVDGGRDWAGARVVGALRALGVDDLELVVATHPDADHVGGLPEVLGSVGVGALVTGPPEPGDEQDRRLREAARARGVRTLEAGAGSVLRVGEARLRFLGPRASGADDNARSLVFVLEWRGRRVLFTGDAPVSEEARWEAGAVDVLKVGHHGSAGSTGEELLERSRPRLAVIGVGANVYGHPTPAVLERLRRHGVAVRRTDLEGAVRVALR